MDTKNFRAFFLIWTFILVILVGLDTLSSRGVVFMSWIQLWSIVLIVTLIVGTWSMEFSEKLPHFLLAIFILSFSTVLLAKNSNKENLSQPTHLSVESSQLVEKKQVNGYELSNVEFDNAIKNYLDNYQTLIDNQNHCWNETINISEDTIKLYQESQKNYLSWFDYWDKVKIFSHLDQNIYQLNNLCLSYFLKARIQNIQEKIEEGDSIFGEEDFFDQTNDFIQGDPTISSLKELAKEWAKIRRHIHNDENMEIREIFRKNQ